MRRIIRKADVGLFVILLVIGLGSAWLAWGGQTKGDHVQITVDGELYGSYPLEQDREITVQDGDHVNKIIIKEGQVQMDSASCNNQVCVDTGAISQTGETIVCLPNRVYLTITGEGGDYDVISQ